jgi:hypothetical protein
VPVGTEVTYNMRARFEGNSGTGTRTDSTRPCDLNAFKQESAIAPGTTPDAAVIAPTQPVDDDGDWSAARAADTYDAYMDYLKVHPQGRHAAEARREAADVRPIANAVPAEPPIGQLAPGATAFVDDHSCKRGEIKVITGGNIYSQPKVVRTKKCVPRDQLP